MDTRNNLMVISRTTITIAHLSMKVVMFHDFLKNDVTDKS